MVCIKKEDVQKANDALKAQGFSLKSLHKAFPTTEKRVAFLSEQFNDRAEAEFFNNKFERYVLNKQKDAMREWIKKSQKKGIDTMTTKTLLEKVDSLKKVLQKGSKGDESLLNGLVKQKLGFTITVSETKELLDKNNNLINSKKALLKKHPDYMKWTTKQFDKAVESGDEAITDLANKIIEMKRIYDDAKVRADSVKETTAGKVVSKISYFGGGLKSAKATLDVSVGRQMLPAFLSGAFNSGQFKQVWNAYKKGWAVWGKVISTGNAEQRQNAIDMAEGLIMVRPNSLNGNYAKLGVAVGIREEAFPESWLQKMFNKKPIVGNLLQASDVMYNISLQTARANLTDALIEQYNGDIGALKSMNAGAYVNYLTGRGVGLKDEQVMHYLNTLAFAPRWFTATVQRVTDAPYLAIKGATGVKLTDIEKARLKTSAANYALMGFLIAVSGALRAADPDDPHGDDAMERFFSAFDPRSSDFGKLVWGDTRFDATGGMAGVITATSRSITGESITVSGVTREKKRSDVIGTYFEGKASPAVHAVINTYKFIVEKEPKDFMYQDITLLGMIANAVVPITAENIGEAFTTDTESRSAQIAGIMADIFGIGSNTYGIDDRSIGKSDELRKEEARLAWQENRNPSSLEPAANSSIKTKLSGKKQTKAIDDFKKQFNKEATALVKSAKYKRMSDSEKSDALSKVRQKVNKDIKKKYGIK